MQVFDKLEPFIEKFGSTAGKLQLLFEILQTFPAVQTFEF